MWTKPSGKQAKHLLLICDILQVKTINKTKPFPPTKRERVYKLKITVQNNRKKPITINIDKINNITNGLRESFNGIVKSFNEVSKKHRELIESYNESFEIHREAIKCKKDTAVSIYTDDTLEGMRKLHGFNIKLWNEKDNTDFFDFVVWGVNADCIENEDERINLPFYDFILSITGREVQHKSVEYYNKLREALKQTDAKQLSTPAAKAEAQGNGEPENTKLKLIDIFEDISKYVHIMGLLVEKKNIQEHSFIWKDTCKGHKSTIINILKDLSNKGYYKSEYTPVTNQFCIDIAKNTFNIKIRMSTAEKAKHSIHYIPRPTTIA